MISQLIIVMGVTGCGKSTVGQAIATKLAIPFIDGDDLHPPENVARMQAGKPLDDESRKPWLAAICQTANQQLAQDQSLVVACSALKRIYRNQLREGLAKQHTNDQHTNDHGATTPTANPRSATSLPIRFIFLQGEPALIEARLQARAGHFMPPNLLASQFADLEDPTGEPDVLVVDIRQTALQMAEQVAAKLQASSRTSNHSQGADTPP